MSIASLWKGGAYRKIQDQDRQTEEDTSELLAEGKEIDTLPTASSVRAGKSRRASRNVILVAILLAWIATALAAISFWKQLVNFKRGAAVITPGVPYFEPQSVYWGPHLVMGDVPSEESDKAWEALMPVGKGFVRIDDGRKNKAQSKIYGVSAYHQLHCLYMVRERVALTISPDEVEAYQTRLREDYEKYGRKDDYESSVYASSTANKGDGHHNESLHHVFHCMDYWRQAIMCLADATLEHLDGEGAPGWGDVHQCRNWDALTKWSYENRVNDLTVGIH